MMRRNRRASIRSTLALATIPATLVLASCGGATPTYDVSVAFNERYTDAAGAVVETAIHDYDASANVILQTSFPPVAHATVHTNATSFCDKFRQRLMSRSEIVAINCAAR
jgi:hypothetical protein